MATTIDTFTGDFSIPLPNHVADTGEAWAPCGGFGGKIFITDSDRARSQSAGLSLVWNSRTYASLEYQVEAVLYCRTTPLDNPFQNAGITLGCSEITNDGYVFRYEAGTWHLFSWTLPTNLSVPATLTPGQSYRLRLTRSVSGGNVTIRAFVDGVQVLTETHAGAGSEPIGRAGIAFQGMETDESGVHIGYFSTDVLSASLPTPPPESAYNNVAPSTPAVYFTEGNWASPSAGTYATSTRGAYFKTRFSGTSCKLLLAQEYLSAQQAQSYPRLRWRVDGGAWQVAQMALNLGIFPLASGLATGTHDLEVHIYSTDSFLDRWYSYQVVVKKLRLDMGATLSAPTIAPLRLWAWGDSITEGDSVTGASGYGVTQYNDAQAAWASLLAPGLTSEISLIAFGGQGWTQGAVGFPPGFTTAWNLQADGVSRSFTTPPDIAFVNMGTNGTVTPSTVQNWLASARAALGAACKLYLFVPFGGFNRADITAGFNAYQSATPDSKTFLRDLGAGFTFTKTDSVHPDTAGHIAIANAVAPLVAPPDIASPGAPTITAIGASEKIILSGTAPLDADTAGVRFYRAGIDAAIADVPAIPGQSVGYSDSGLVNGVAYSYTARAYDTSNNLSLVSASVTATPTALTDYDLGRIRAGLATSDNVAAIPVAPTAAQNAAAVWSNTEGKKVLANAAGKWAKDGDTLRLYDTDGTTILVTLTLAPAGGPYTSATPTP